MQVKEERGRGRSGAVAGGLRRRAAEWSRGKEGEEEGEGGADRWAPGISDSKKKKKKKRRRAAAGEVKCAGGPLGRKVRGKVLSFFFLFRFKPFLNQTI
jgi:hypothetical protein